jgi:hypothetical protein
MSDKVKLPPKPSKGQASSTNLPHALDRKQPPKRSTPHGSVAGGGKGKPGESTDGTE